MGLTERPLEVYQRCLQDRVDSKKTIQTKNNCLQMLIVIFLLDVSR
jgi:hypothetical protein